MLEPSEKAIQTAVIAHWRVFGVPGSMVAAIPNERAHGQPGLTRGLSDLLVLCPGLPIGFIELKAARGRLSAHQRSFLAILDRCGVKCAVTFGRDEPIAVLEQWGVVRRSCSA